MSSRTQSVFLSNLHHALAQTDGTYRFPNSLEGDLLKTAKREIEELLQDRERLDWLNRIDDGAFDWFSHPRNIRAAVDAARKESTL